MTMHHDYAFLCFFIQIFTYSFIMSSSDNPVAFMMSAMLKPIDHKGIFFFFFFTFCSFLVINVNFICFFSSFSSFCFPH